MLATERKSRPKPKRHQPATVQQLGPKSAAFRFDREEPPCESLPPSQLTRSGPTHSLLVSCASSISTARIRALAAAPSRHVQHLSFQGVDSTRDGSNPKQLFAGVS